MEKTYRIEYWEHTSTTIDVVAASEDEALEKAKEIVECGELDLGTMELGDCGYEPMGEVADEHQGRNLISKREKGKQDEQ